MPIIDAGDEMESVRLSGKGARYLEGVASSLTIAL
jgi:hypothetical protein